MVPVSRRFETSTRGDPPNRSRRSRTSPLRYSFWSIAGWTHCQFSSLCAERLSAQAYRRGSILLCKQRAHLRANFLESRGLNRSPVSKTAPGFVSRLFERRTLFMSPVHLGNATTISVLRNKRPIFLNCFKAKQDRYSSTRRVSRGEDTYRYPPAGQKIEV
jgi:hypothetical protein